MRYGRYLGEGHTGTVFHGELGVDRVGTGKSVAVKQSHPKPPRKAASETEHVERLQKEINLLEVTFQLARDPFAKCQPMQSSGRSLCLCTFPLVHTRQGCKLSCAA